MSGQYTEQHCKNVVKGYVLPGLLHPLLAADQNESWLKVRQAYERIQSEIDEIQPDRLLIYSTYWASILGHQIQAQPAPKWTLVDDEWHELGSVPYELKVDVEFSENYNQVCLNRGLKSRTVNYQGFPIDTGTVVANKLLNPENRYPMTVVSSNIYSDRAETLILGKAAREALEKDNKKTVVLVITSLSNRYRNDLKFAKEETFTSRKDEEWSYKFLEFFKKGRLEDVSQLSRQFHHEARVTKKVTNYKPFWWMAGVMGETNAYSGEVYECQPIHGTAAALIGLTPSAHPAPDLEFDEDHSEIFPGDRGVLSDPKAQSFDPLEDEL